MSHLEIYFGKNDRKMHAIIYNENIKLCRCITDICGVDDGRDRECFVNIWCQKCYIQLISRHALLVLLTPERYKENGESAFLTHLYI